MPRPSLLDACVALALFGVAVAELLGAQLADDVVEGSPALNLAAVAVMTLPLAFRRQAPLAVGLMVFGAFGARALAGPPLEIYPTVAAAIIAVYTVAAYAGTRDGVIAFGVFALATGIAADRGSGGDAAPDLVPSLILAAGVFAVGLVARYRQEGARGIERRAEERAATAAAEERARLARELHDAVSHSLASIVMQAGGAQDAARRDPDRAVDTLGSIEHAAREGLGEMRRLLGLIGDGSAPRAPQPTVAHLEDLVAGARMAGLEVSTSVEGARRTLPPTVDLSAYRIVQEALTNAMKHAGRCRVSVTLRYRCDALDIEVDDDGTGPPDASRLPGRGLSGMRERASVLGGELEAGPGPDGRGFRVHVRLPLEPVG